MDDRIDRWRERAETPFTADREALAADLSGRDDDDTERSVRVLSGLGGFVSSLIFLLFLWLTDLLTQPVVSVALGLALVAVTIWLGRQRRQAFLATITVCGYLVGVGLTVVGLPPDFSDPQLAGVVLALAAMTLAATRNYYLVFLATVSVPACLLFLHVSREGAGWLWLAVGVTLAGVVAVTFLEARLIRSRRLAPVRTGLVTGLLLSLVWLHWADWIVPHTVIPGSIAVPFLGSILLLLLSHRNQHALGAGLGVSGLIYFTGQSYYDLRWNLLDKSLILMGAGALLLATYYLIRHNFPPREEA